MLNLQIMKKNNMWVVKVRKDIAGPFVERQFRTLQKASDYVTRVMAGSAGSE